MQFLVVRAMLCPANVAAELANEVEGVLQQAELGGDVEIPLEELVVPFGPLKVR